MRHGTFGHQVAVRSNRDIMVPGMQRNLGTMTEKVYDVLVIGGGIHGACIAWEAALRGLSVALVEKADFCSATSANSLKIIHGGLRYLQHADFKRMRESIGERRNLMRIAPHLIHPLPILFPTRGHGLQGREVMTVALALNDLISSDRNRQMDPQKHLPRGRTISRKTCQELLPDLCDGDVTGGAIFYDAQVYNSERLPLAFLRSAAHAGADLANYAEVVGFLQQQQRLVGATVRDRLSGAEIDIRARMIVNTAGPWVRQVLGQVQPGPAPTGPYLAKAINLVTRPLFHTYAVGLASRKNFRDSDAVINKGSRLLFTAPWRGYSMIGTEYIAYHGNPDDFVVTETEIRNFIDEINQAYPAARLERSDVSFVQGGLVPISGVDPRTGSVQLTKHFTIDDHQHEGLHGLISVVGVKYTTARYVAEKVIDKVFAMRGQQSPPSRSAVMPLYGGHIEDFEGFLQATVRKQSHGLKENIVRQLVYSYGSAYPDVLRYLEQPDALPPGISAEMAVLRAETLHGIHMEMAQKLADIVFRRTELGTAGHPGDQTLHFVAEVMGAELGWSRAHMEQELQEIYDNTIWTAENRHDHGSTLADPALQQVGVETAQV